MEREENVILKGFSSACGEVEYGGQADRLAGRQVGVGCWLPGLCVELVCVCACYVLCMPMKLTEQQEPLLD